VVAWGASTQARWLTLCFMSAAGALKRTYYKAHFELGADATEYVSSNASAYERPQQARSTKVNHDRAIMTQPNFYLGLEKADMRSMASTDYDAKVVDVRATRATAAALKKGALGAPRRCIWVNMAQPDRCVCHYRPAVLPL